MNKEDKSILSWPKRILKRFHMVSSLNLSGTDWKFYEVLQIKQEYNWEKSDSEITTYISLRVSLIGFVLTSIFGGVVWDIILRLIL